jgi:acetyltransferase
MVARGARLQGSFVRFPNWEDGPIAIVAQSGIFAGALAHEVMSRDVGRLGIRTSIAVGNRIGVTEADLLAALGDDDEIGVIGFYLESFADPRVFLRAAAEVKTRKPVVVLKPGRSSPGATAAASHTGSLTGDDAVIDQLLRQHGIVRAADDEEFVAILDSFANGPVPRGPRLGLVTFSGAMGVIATDLADEGGLELPAYTDETVARFSALLPDWQGVGNPADLWPAVDLDPAEAICGGLAAAIGDPTTDQVLGILLAVPNADFEGMRERFAALREAEPDKPLHLVISGGLRERWTRELDGLGIPIHPSLRIAVRSLSALTWYGRVRDQIPTATARELAAATGGTQ